MGRQALNELDEIPEKDEQDMLMGELLVRYRDILQSPPSLSKADLQTCISSLSLSISEILNGKHKVNNQSCLFLQNFRSTRISPYQQTPFQARN